MNKEKKLIPELRFPEFVNEGEWLENKLGKCLTQKPEYGINAPAVAYSSSLPTYLRITDISEEGYFLSDTKVSVAKAVSDDNYLKEGDLVLARTGASVGKAYKYREKDGELVFAGFLIRVRPDKKKLNSELLFQFLSTTQYWTWVSLVSARSGQPGINGTEYASMPIILPPKIDEQQKIAACLSSLDDLIEAHNQKLEALKNHKKGLMQNLFPQNGEKVPKFRFPEFVNDGEWVENTLGGVADKNTRWSFTGGPFGSNLKASDYTKDGFRIIQLQNIGDGEFNDESKIFTSEEKANELLSCNIYAGDIIISKMGDPVGRACIIPDNLTRCVMASDGIRLVVDEKNFSKYFIYTLINSSSIRESIESKSTGSTRKRIGLDVLRSIGLLLPKERDEQEKIATCLLTLDETIKAEALRIEQLKEHKKGLMQGLFPS